MRSQASGSGKARVRIVVLDLLASLLALTSPWVSAGRLLQTSGSTTPVPTLTPPATAQPTPGHESGRSALVTINNQTLFHLQNRIGSITPAERAGVVSAHFNSLITNPFISPSALSLVDKVDATDIMADDQFLITVTDSDAPQPDVIDTNWLRPGSKPSTRPSGRAKLRTASGASSLACSRRWLLASFWSFLFVGRTGSIAVPPWLWRPGPVTRRAGGPCAN
jgi:hypothetical protein